MMHDVLVFFSGTLFGILLFVCTRRLLDWLFDQDEFLDWYGILRRSFGRRRIINRGGKADFSAIPQERKAEWAKQTATAARERAFWCENGFLSAPSSRMRVRRAGLRSWVAEYQDKDGKTHQRTFPTISQAKAHLDRAVIDESGGYGHCGGPGVSAGTDQIAGRFLPLACRGRGGLLAGRMPPCGSHL
jgi:hypothetical protein